MIEVIHILGIIIALSGVVVVLYKWRRIDKSLSFILITLLCGYCGFSMLLFIEWYGLSNSFEDFEDLIGALLPIFWTILFYTLLQKEKLKDLRHVFNAISDPVFLYPMSENVNARFISINSTACTKYGYPIEDFLKMSIIDITKPENYMPQNDKILKGKLKKYGRLMYESMHVTSSGKDLPVEINASLIEHNDKPAILAVVRDLTKRKQMEIELKESNEKYAATNEELTASFHAVKEMNAQLEESKEKAEMSDKLKTTFLANLSHEVRTPMNGILGFSNLLRSKNLPEQKKELYLDQIEISSQRLLNLIEDLVDISKIESGIIDLHEEKINLNKLFDDLEDLFSLLAKRKKLQLTLKKGTDDEQCNIVSDKLKLEQILSNLLNNAIKYTSKGAVNFGYGLREDDIYFWVTDTGKGIPEDKQDVIFERFRQAESTPLREEEGSGLGLAISKGFVELMGGNIGVDSEVGLGATFWFTVPYVKTGNSFSEKLNSENDLSVFRKVTILIAEDDDTSSLYLNTILSDNNISLLNASNGNMAVEIARQHPEVDLILMDIKMPQKNGIEATTEIRKFRPNVPIIAQTAYASKKDRIKALGVGCNDFISKPIDRNELYAKLDCFLK